MKKENLIEQIQTLVASINALPANERNISFFDEIEKELKNLKVGESDSVYALIYVTKDLTQFKDIDGNRIINPETRYIERLSNSIRLRGIHVPVLTNENFGVADGQRRIAAIRRHGLPNAVPYFREYGVTIDDVADMNINLVKWGWRDQLNRWVRDNREDYVEYDKHWSKYEPLMQPRSLRGLLMVGRVDALPRDVWDSGLFQINKENIPLIKTYMEILEKTYIIGGKENIFAKNRNFQKALFEMFVNTKKLDVDRLLVKLRNKIGDINVNYDYKKYKEVLARIYNTRLSPDNPHMVIENEEPIDPKIKPSNNGKKDRKKIA